MATKIILIYVTHANLKEAQKIVSFLLKKKLIACANFLPINSVYRWQGKIENSSEIVSLLKTKEKNWEKIKSEIKKLHSYQTPCIIKINATANEDYASWINKETK